MRIALLGCGTVGGGVLTICDERVNHLEVARILTLPGELDDPRVTCDLEAIVDDASITCVVEAMGGIEPAHSFILRALEAGKSVVTANKAVVAAHFAEFQEVAASQGVAFMVEATSGGGVPWIASLEKVRRIDTITSISGILNGTSNYIIDAMEREELGFDEALSQAQQLGYAEADPSADIDGIDVANKMIISSTVAFGSLCRYEIPRLGIRYLTKDILNVLAAQGCSVRLLGRARQVPGESGTGGRYSACVEPVVLSAQSLEAHVPTNFNLAALEATTVGELKFYGQGAGALPTGNAIVQDLLDVAAGARPRYATQETLRWDPGLLSASYLVATQAVPPAGAEVLDASLGLYLVREGDPKKLHDLVETLAQEDAHTFAASLAPDCSLAR